MPKHKTPIRNYVNGVWSRLINQPLPSCLRLLSRLEPKSFIIAAYVINNATTPALIASALTRRSSSCLSSSTSECSCIFVI